jgi:hypothetical protein
MTILSEKYEFSTERIVIALRVGILIVFYIEGGSLKMKMM